MIDYSVIIPHFTKTNTKLLERAVQSVPNAKNIEVLVIDNSPTPISENLFNNRLNVNILYSNNTKGAGHARNVGINNAKGKWLLFLDADDFFLNAAFDIMDKYISSNSDIIFFKMTSKFSDTLENATRHIAYEKIIDEYFINNNEYKIRCEYPSPCGKMVNSSLVQFHGIQYDEVPASNDVMFALKIGLFARKIEVDENYIYCATVQKGSLTNTISLENIESRFNVNIRKNALLKEYGYKRSSSVMYFIVSSAKFGFKPFFKLFFKALLSGNLFIGYDRWFSTYINKSYKKNDKYTVENN